MKTALIVILLLILVIIFRSKISTYAPPRDVNTVLPFVEPSNNYPVADNQSNVFIDAGGWINQREHPLAPFLQSNLYTKGDFGDFVGLESSSGDAPMYVIAADEQYMYNEPSQRMIGTYIEQTGDTLLYSRIPTGEYIPNITSRTIPLLGDTLIAAEQQVSSTSQ